MNPLHQYEAWLDELDQRLRVDSGNIVCELGSGLIAPLSELTDVDDIALWAGKLRESLAAHEGHLPHEYLVKRFARLAKERTGLPVNVDEIAWEATVGYRRR
ncbi:hypothetical protein KIH07_01810 [Hydrogenophaga taeniospiralis]|uniref:hypothetical protein n=1 Tax=Hydrogenophaga taeniospiralis TaxID=65656 RepID=UPI001CFA5D6D|nr:hypothetical protein [Hydrogenophaga taeniospiralis]MCB4362449.1 hypothetical protein [Hydrogenophaga taeniospiralis]